MKEDHIVEVYTICLGRWRLLKDSDVELKDVTFKSATPELKKLFAPPNFQLVVDYKTGKISPCDYEEAYINKIKRSSSLYYDEWLEFLYGSDKMALACYCSDEHKCHRTLLAEFLKTFGEDNEIEVKLMGEIKEPLKNV